VKVTLTGFPAGNTAVSFYVTPDGSPDSAVVSKTIALRRLTRDRIVQASFRVDWTAMSGPPRVLAVVDPLNAVPEDREDDNTILSPPYPERDLRATWMQGSCTPYSGYEVFRGKLNLWVDGWDPNTPFKVWMGASETTDPADATVTRTVKLGLRGSRTLSTSLKMPGHSDCAQHMLAVLDPEGIVVETDKSNNLTVWP
jgi:hypothetical protein